mmetsp:Transcript_30030/g.39507  ORF Transcript_30030/g.39507 Transcript_30030/m.39507 type:complete len:236 (-) Transcript_30030:333-1040(-)
MRDLPRISRCLAITFSIFSRSSAAALDIGFSAGVSLRGPLLLKFRAVGIILPIPFASPGVIIHSSRSSFFEVFLRLGFFPCIRAQSSSSCSLCFFLMVSSFSLSTIPIRVAFSATMGPASLSSLLLELYPLDSESLFRLGGTDSIISCAQESWWADGRIGPITAGFGGPASSSFSLSSSFEDKAFEDSLISFFSVIGSPTTSLVKGIGGGESGNLSPQASIRAAISLSSELDRFH